MRLLLLRILPVVAAVACAAGAHAQVDAPTDRADGRAANPPAPAPPVTAPAQPAPLGPRPRPAGAAAASAESGREVRLPGRGVQTCADAKLHAARVWGGVGLLLGATAALLTPTSRAWQTYALLGVPTGAGAFLGYRTGARSRACGGA